MKLRREKCSRVTLFIGSPHAFPGDIFRSAMSNARRQSADELCQVWTSLKARGFRGQEAFGWHRRGTMYLLGVIGRIMSG